MNKKGNHKVAGTSISALFIVSGVQMHISQMEPATSTLSIWFGLIILLTLGIIQVYEKVESETKNKI